MTGMLSAIVAPLAAGELPVVVASSFHGDLVLVPAGRLNEASTCCATLAPPHCLLVSDRSVVPPSFTSYPAPSTIRISRG